MRTDENRLADLNSSMELEQAIRHFFRKLGTVPEQRHKGTVGLSLKVDASQGQYGKTAQPPVVR
jgi:hypothetical protein